MKKWKTEVEKDEHMIRCLVSFLPKGGKETTVTDGWVDGYGGKFMYQDYKPSAYMPYPEPFTKKTKGWKSVYLGDEEPPAGMYIVSARKGLYEYVKYRYWNPWSKYHDEDDVIMAWRDPPKPYKG